MASKGCGLEAATRMKLLPGQSSLRMKTVQMNSYLSCISFLHDGVGDRIDQTFPQAHVGSPA